MQFNTTLFKKLPFYVALSSLFVLGSCGSYQYVGYDDDGIYNPDDSVIVVERQVETPNTTSQNSEYYKDYFGNTSKEIESITNENEVFTDIDSYEGSYKEEAQDSLDYRTGYAGWGQANDQIIINIDNRPNWGWGWGYGWNDPWLWNGWGWNRWNRWGWYNPWAWNAGWGWNVGWGWNTWGWNSWGWNAGWGWNNPYWYGVNSGFYNNNVAFINGRRGSLLASNNTINRRNGTSSYLNDRRINSFNTRRNSSGTSRLNSSSTTRNTRFTGANGTVRNNSTRIRTGQSGTRVRNNQSNNTRVRSNNSTRVRSNNSSRNTRSNTSKSSTRRSSGGVRSSSSSGRSSGGVSRGSSSSRSSGSSRGGSSRGSSRGRG